MKKLNVLFLSLILSGFVFPTISNAQVTRWSSPAYLNFKIDGTKYAIHSLSEEIIVFDIETRAKITPSGNCQVKSEFNVSSTGIDLPEYGKVEIPIERFAVWVEAVKGMNYHFVAEDAILLVGSDGMAKVVYNWEVSEASPNY